jgi:circadian clock protein KaiB
MKSKSAKPSKTSSSKKRAGGVPPPSKPKAKKAAITKPPGKNGAGSELAAPTFWSLRLYVAGQTPRSLTAFANLKRLCEEFLPPRQENELVDLAKAPQHARGDEIVALPT